MNAVKLLFTIAFLSAASLQSAQAQADSTKNHAASSNMAISLSAQPLYILSSAIKMDLELHKPTGRFGYVISPEFYSGNISDDRENHNRNGSSPDRIKGFGLGIHQKLKFKKQLVSSYFAYGATFRSQTITYHTESFIPYGNDGLSYYSYGPVDNRIKIKSLLVSAVMGFQTLDWDVLLMDAYIGFGYKLADLEMTYAGERRYDKNYFSPAYQGPLFMLGVKFGAQIKR